MPKAFPLAHDAGHGPGTRRGNGTDEKCTERLPPGALEDSLSVARAAYLPLSLVGASMACGDHAGA